MAIDAPADSHREPIVATSREVSCDGGDGAYGHPKVYLKIADKQVTCPYCSRLFVLGPSAGTAAH